MRATFSILFLLLPSSLCLEQPGGNISVGQILKAGDWWISTKGTFAIGLREQNLAIWHPSTNTVVWNATRNTPEGGLLQVSKNSNLNLQRDGLYIGGIPVYTCNDSCTVSAAMQDDGNFVVFGTSKNKLWQSFNKPTTTLLAGQTVSGEGVVLTSGKFSLRLQRNSIQLESKDFSPPPPDYVAYWSMSNTSFNASDRSLNKDPTLKLSKSGVLTFTDASGKAGQSTEGTIKYTSDYNSSNVMRRLVLEPNGNLRIYSLFSTSWDTVVWQAKLKECDIYTFCGAFGLCSYSPVAKCNCPPGYKDGSGGGCVQNIPLDCNSSKLIELTRTDYDYNDLSGPKGPMSIEECKNMCQNNCDCLAAAYKLDGNGQCYLKGQEGKGTAGKLYNGRQSPVDANTIIYLKVSDTANDPATVTQPQSAFVTNVSGIYLHPTIETIHKDTYFAKTAQVVVFSLAIGELVVFIIVCTMLRLAWKRDIRRMIRRYTIDIEGAPANFWYKELQAATNNFSEKLGSGSFGSVFKGVLPDKRIIAVKQLDGAVQAEKQFKAEVSTIGKIHHVNLVRLIGYCAERNHRLLVLEYMPNGSLEKLLFSSDPDKNTEISSQWNIRYSIALGIARGVTYLHEECHECILHCDIKPENILLDEQYTPKVSDFGLAKLVSKEGPLTITTIAGTRGYLAPEWISNSQITSKVDVFSFGMVLLELLCGRDNFRLTPSAIQEDRWPFPPWALRKYKEHDMLSLADPRLAAGEIIWEQFERMLKVAFWCIQEQPDSRPSMSKVVQMLEGSNEVPQLPSKVELDAGLDLAIWQFKSSA